MPQQNKSPEENKQVVQKFVEECWNQGNLNKASELSRRPSPFPRSSLPQPEPRNTKHQNSHRGMPQGISRSKIHHRRHDRRTQ